jgi:hypothetical protein
MMRWRAPHPWRARARTHYVDGVHEMKTTRRIVLLVLLAVGASLATSGCAPSREPAGPGPAQDHPSGEHPKKDHPSGEHPKGEHPK